MLNKLLKNNFRKNIILMMGGVTFAKLIPFFTLPFLYRIYDEADFGKLYLFISLASLLAAVGTLSYEFAIVLEKRLVKAMQLTFTTFLILFAFCGLMFFLVYAFEDFFARTLGLKDIRHVLLWVPVAAFLVGGGNVLNYWLNRAMLFKNIAIGRITNSTSAESVKVYSGLHSPHYTGLIGGYLTGIFVMNIFYSLSFLKVLKKLRHKLSFKSAKSLMKAHQKFPRYNLPSGLISNGINFIYIALFMEFFGADVAGNLGLSINYAYGAFSLISVAYSQVFYNEIAPIEDPQKLRKFYWKNARFLALIGLGIILAVQLVPTSVYVWALGEKASNLTPILKIMIVWMGVSFVSSSLSFVYAKINAQDKMFWLDLLHIILVPLSIYIGYSLEWGLLGTLWLFTAVQLFHYIVALSLVNILITRWKK